MCRVDGPAPSLTRQKEDISPGLEKPEIGKTEHTGIYSSSGFDVLGALVRLFLIFIAFAPKGPC